jgi:hypothetical protein
MLDSTLFDLMAIAEKSAPIAEMLRGRNLFVEPAIVTHNDDPETRRRVKAKLAKSPETTTDWLDRLNFSPFDDPPVPKVGQTIVVAFYSGDGHTGCYFGTIINEKNQEMATDAPLIDHGRVVEGDNLQNVGRDKKTVVARDSELLAGRWVRIKNESGASIELHPAGVATVQDAFGNKVILGGASGGLGLPSDVIFDIQSPLRIDLNGQILQIFDASGVTINGQQVATIGAIDTDGDTLTTRGW